MEDVWKAIWKMKVPQKIKLFAWRCCRDIIPTKSNLHHRKIPINVGCPLCLMHEETCSHILWGCKKVKVIWQEVFAAVWEKVKNIFKMATSPSTFVDNLLSAQSTVTAEVIWVIAWFIWNSRNGFVMQNFVPDFSSIPAKSLAWLTEWHEAKEREGIGVNITAGTDLMSKWSPPPPNVFKINFDGALFPSQNCAGAGVVIRNDKGSLWLLWCASWKVFKAAIT